MKLRLSFLTLSLAFCTASALAQAPAGAPANATGLCKDGTYWTGTTKSGACRGHKGIQTWFAASTSTPSATASAPAVNAPPPAAAATPAAVQPKPSPTVPKAVKQPATAAPGGGPGLVWVNTSTKVYHCYGDRYYGTTKDGKYMSEADAKAMGARPNRGSPCSK
jgi:hypothetical protein